MEGEGVTSPRLTWIDGLPHYAYPVLKAAGAQTLRIITERPGATAYDVAEVRGVTPRAAHATMRLLERLELITTRLEHSPTTTRPYHRAAYPVRSA